jgi:hypothetical protein
MAWNEQAERLRARVHRRAFGYRALFLIGDERPSMVDTAPWWAFWRKPTGGTLKPAADIVLADLAHYCYAKKPTLKVSQVDQHTDPLAMAFAEGRRDVFNRITAMCNLTSDQIDRIAHSRSDSE